MDARTLVAVVADGKERLTDRSLESVARLASPQVDVVVFDEGDDSALRAGLTSYRSPRPLGPARTLNVAFLHALSAGYGAVLACEPAVTVPVGVVAALHAVAGTARVASVAAWTTPGLDQDVVDWIPSAVGDAQGPVDARTAAGPCVLFPAAALRDVGLFDPLYTSGQDHLIDWAQRAIGLGYRCVAAPAVHVSGGRTAPPPGPSPSALLGFRHPTYVPAPLADAVPSAAIVVAAAHRFGYTLEVGWPAGADEDGPEVRVYVEPDGERPVVSGYFCGFSAPLPVERHGDDVADAVAALLGGEPREVIVSERVRYASAFAASAPFMYPKRI